jgi:glycerol-3-phosphate dehydrogenase
MPLLRCQQLDALQSAPLDILILGGGINGAGTARDLALRAQHGQVPLRIGVIDKGQFGSGTSSRNSHLIHGGLRYLKMLDFGLVRQALRERRILLDTAPQWVQPLRFLMPFERLPRALFYRCGIWLYDLLAARNAIGAHQSLNRKQLLDHEPGLSADFCCGAAYWDARVESARLVLENIKDAVRRGAIAANYVEAVSYERQGTWWSVLLRDRIAGREWTQRARLLVDATGAWTRSGTVRLVRGSHIVVPRINRSDDAVAYFEPSGRIVFFIPWGSQRDVTLIGTTDVEHGGSPDDVQISAEETEYLLGIARRVFGRTQIGDPVGSFSSLRPLIPTPARSATWATREHRIWRDEHDMVHITGGKYTTYRAMAEEAADLACERVAPELAGIHLTAATPFADHPPADRLAVLRQAFCEDMAQTLEDLLYVSTTWGYERRWSPEELRELAEQWAAVQQC